jgi:hypothetical protein
MLPDGGTCKNVQTECASQAECCGMLSCAQVGGLTTTWCCVGMGQPCSDANDCCGQLLCNNNTCQ